MIIGVLTFSLVSVLAGAVIAVKRERTMPLGTALRIAVAMTLFYVLTMCYVIWRNPDTLLGGIAVLFFVVVPTYFANLAERIRRKVADRK